MDRKDLTNQYESVRYDSNTYSDLIIECGQLECCVTYCIFYFKIFVIDLKSYKRFSTPFSTYP
jgi:hypothetical protein